MNGNDKSSDDKKATEEPTQKELELKQALENIQQKVDQSSLLNEIISDPQVAEILKARKEGREVVIKDLEDKPSEENDDPFAVLDKPQETDLDLLSNKELLGMIGKMVKDSISGQVSEALKPVASQIDEVSKSLKTEQVSRSNVEIQAQIEAVHTKYGEDFSKRRDNLIEIYNQYGNLSPYDTYAMSVGRDHLENPPQNSVDTERPTNVFSREIPVAEQQRKGLKGFSEMLNESLSKRY